jgi:hypothetical protein
VSHQLLGLAQCERAFVVILEVKDDDSGARTFPTNRVRPARFALGTRLSGSGFCKGLAAPAVAGGSDACCCGAIKFDWATNNDDDDASNGCWDSREGVNVKPREVESDGRKSSLSRSGFPVAASEAACIDRPLAGPDSECCGGAPGKVEVIYPIVWSGEGAPYE